MQHARPRRVRAIVITASLLLVTALLLLIRRDSSLGMLVLQGVVLRQDRDVRRQQPIGDAQIDVHSGRTRITVQTDSQGYFRIPLHKVVLPGARLDFNITHPGFEPLMRQMSVGLRSSRHQLYLFHLAESAPAPSDAAKTESETRITNVRIRFVENGTTANNIGSVARSFEAVNQGDIRCDGHAPCSPDGRWKASYGQSALDAGAGNEFRQVRVSCIAGPCPFTRIDDSGYAKGGEKISVRVLNWSDTATFLIEAEVYHSSLNSAVHHLFPVFFGRTFNFTLPSNEEGVSIEAELNGTLMVFPLGPDANMSWTSCTERDSDSADQARVYHCELKPGYSF